MKLPLSVFAVSLLAVETAARSVPANVEAFRKRITNGKCTGGVVLKDDFYSEYPGKEDFAYCQDNATGVLYLHGPGSKFANMDIDCDGKQVDPSGRCKSSTDTQDETAFKSLVQQYSRAAGDYVSDLDSNFIPYVVFGNQGHQKGYTTFHPRAYGMQPLSVMAVVCGNKLIYGVWGDTNGDDGKPLIGEASISLGTACYGDSVNGNKAHSQDGVLYIGFPGSVADTVNMKAAWNATHYEDFESSIEALGNGLIEKL